MAGHPLGQLFSKLHEAFAAPGGTTHRLVIDRRTIEKTWKYMRNWNMFLKEEWTNQKDRKSSLSVHRDSFKSNGSTLDKLGKSKSPTQNIMTLLDTPLNF